MCIGVARVMRNVNYNLIKLLHTTLDTIWRLENYYIKDAGEAKCHSLACLQEMLETEKKYAQALREEIKMRIEAGVFD